MFSADGQRVATGRDARRAQGPQGHGSIGSVQRRTSEDKTARVWAISTQALQRCLRAATTDCLSPEMRRTYLDESDEDARKGYESCERSYGRTPFYPEIDPP
ncbi:hypothetical protein BE20_42805 [Sorangium cellulosum]|nr:hypothetical protein BE20_42805 [Sorangium cellulosum]